MTNQEPAQDRSRAQARRHEPSLSPPPYILNRHGARVLDSTNALRLPGRTIRPTVYVGSRLLVPEQDVAAVSDMLDRAAELAGVSATYTSVDPDLRALADRRGLSELAARVLV